MDKINNEKKLIIKKKNINCFKTKDIPYVLIQYIFSYLCSRETILKYNNFGSCFKTIYKFIQCDKYFYILYHFNIDRYFDKNYKFNKSVNLLNICQYGQIGFLNKYINTFVDFGKKICTNLDYNITQGQKYEPIYIATQNGHLNIIKKIYFCTDRCISLNVKGPYNTTPLIIATKKGYIKIVKFLINELDDNQIISVDNDNRSALHWACIIGYTDIVKLLKKESNTMVDIYNKTPYMYADTYGHYDIKLVLNNY
jgi:ankyrin repeat protein